MAKTEQAAGSRSHDLVPIDGMSGGFEFTAQGLLPPIAVPGLPNDTREITEDLHSAALQRKHFVATETTEEITQL